MLAPQNDKLLRSWPEDLPRRAQLDDVPFYPQEDYQCGPASLASALVHAGVRVTPRELVRDVYIPERKGSVQAEMLGAARRHGTVSYVLASSYHDLLREIASGTPAIVLLDFGMWPLHRWHYAVAAGYDAGAGEVTLRSGTTRAFKMPFEIFEYFWKRSGYWAMVAGPPERVPATAQRARYLGAIIALERAGQARPATRAYSAFLARWPDDVAAHVGLANAYYALGELDLAERSLRAALSLDPHSEIALNNLAQTLSDSDRSDEALRVIDQAAALKGAHGDAIAQTRAAIMQKRALSRRTR
jgi:tetratricopeptide (TPR) repeat protein